MKADTVDLANVFGKPVRYLVPLFQRPYVWEREKQWGPLWADIQAVAERQLDDRSDNDSVPHFMGAIVLDQVLMPTGMIESRYVVDGQQRLTTLQLLVAAARAVALDLAHEKSAQMFEKLLYNDEFLVKSADDRLKVVPTVYDRDAFVTAISDGPAPPGGHRMLDAYRYFRQSVKDWACDGESGAGSESKLDALCTVAWKLLVVVSIDLAPNDNAQVIFETLNARGTPLLAADLIKNHLFQVAASQGANIDSLYAQYWMPLDQEWWRAEIRQGRLRRPRLDIFANYWLAMRIGREVVSHQLFPDFKRFLAGGTTSAEQVLADLAQYAGVYRALEEEPENTTQGRFLYRLAVMEVTTSYPALLWIFGPEGLEPADALQASEAIESWLVRRMLVRATTKNYNSVFLSLLRNLRSIAEIRRPVADDVHDFFSALRGESQYWPSDEHVLGSMRSLPIYTSLTRSRLKLVLESLETQLHTPFTEEFTIDHRLTIEHVLPQAWHLNWPLPSDADPIEAAAERDNIKHLIGNLTLVTGKSNPAMSNSSWPTKRAFLQEHSILRLASDIRSAETWDEAAIFDRTERLARLSLKTWCSPGNPPSESDPDEIGVRTSELVLDPDAAEAVYRLADAAGVGHELRETVSRCSGLGLHIRAFPYSIMFSPPADRRVMIFTVWPQVDEPGTLVVWTSSSALAQLWPGVSRSAAQTALGSDGRRVLDAEKLLHLVSALEGVLGQDTESGVGE